MEKSEESVERDCPFLQPVVADRIWMYPTATYCRPPSGRVRVPAPATVAGLCTNGQYRDCPGYRQARALEMERSGCPFLRARRVSGLRSFSTAVYCLLPSGRVRIPSSDELAQFCAAPRCYDCPRFDRTCVNEMDLTDFG